MSRSVLLRHENKSWWVTESTELVSLDVDASHRKCALTQTPEIKHKNECQKVIFYRIGNCWKFDKKKVESLILLSGKSNSIHLLQPQTRLKSNDNEMKF